MVDANQVFSVKEALIRGTVYEELANNPAQIENCYAIVPDRPGFGQIGTRGFGYHRQPEGVDV